MSALRADCGQCFALCCTALPFARSVDFAIDKPAGTPCPNLAEDYRCRIHQQLKPSGFQGCVTFDCFGAGQHVSQGTFGGISWRTAEAEAMFETFDVMRQLHELLWYLAEVRRRAPQDGEAEALTGRLEQLSEGTPEQLRRLDVSPYRGQTDVVLSRISERARARYPGAKALRGKDLVGRRLVGLRGANLRGALLIAADLSEQDLTDADLLGADLRGADLAGADLTGALFLTQAQLNAARGDARTKAPAPLNRPAQWA